MIKIKQNYTNFHLVCKTKGCKNRARVKDYCTNCYSLSKKKEMI